MFDTNNSSSPVSSLYFVSAYDKRRSSARERQNGGARERGNGGGTKAREMSEEIKYFYKILLFLIPMKQLFTIYLQNYAWIDEIFLKKENFYSIIERYSTKIFLEGIRISFII